MRLLLSLQIILILAVPLFSADIDNKDFNRIYLTDEKKAIIYNEQFEDLTVWNKFSDANTHISLTQADGYKEKCLKSTFDFGSSGEWWVVNRKVDLNLTGGEAVSIFIKMHQPKYQFEIKFIDTDGGVFGKLFDIISNIKPDNWAEVRIEPDEITYLWGGKDKKLDRIKSIEIAMNCQSQYGKGSIYIDNLTIYNSNIKYAECSLSQAGYHPEDSKFAVLRLNTRDEVSDKIPFIVLNSVSGKEVDKGFFHKLDFTKWRGTYYRGDFTEVSKDGKYHLEIKFDPDHILKTNNFIIDERVLNKKVSYMVYRFLRYMRCGQYCHPDDPVLGGYHDTFYDIGKRMWSLTHLIMGMTMDIEHSEENIDKDFNRIDDRMDELLYALQFALQIQLPNGGVSAFGIGHKELQENAKFKIEDDNHERYLDTNPSINTTCYYAGSMAKAYTLIKDKYSVLGNKTRRGAVKAWEYLNKLNLDKSYELGGYLYASAEIYKITNDKKFLNKVLPVINKLQALQDLDNRITEKNIFGDFYETPGLKNNDHQYKFFEYNLEIYLGLLDICSIYPIDSEVYIKARYMLQVYYENYLKKMAGLTPYEQVAHGIEKVNGKDVIAFFSPPDQSWTGAHGFNVDHFSRGYLALNIGYLIGDLWAERFADDQMQWVLGNNPLRYCMVGNTGYNTPKVWSMMNNKGGPIDGGIPNGIVGFQLPFPIWLPVFSSGEYWLPHDAYYLVLSSLLDSRAVLSGKVININTAGKIEIYNNGKKIHEISVNDNGMFGPITLPPQKKYTLKFSSGDISASKEVTLLSGENKKIILNPKSEFTVTADISNTDDGELIFTNKCSSLIDEKIPVILYDGKNIHRSELNLKIKPSEVINILEPFKFNISHPILIICDNNIIFINT